MKKPEEPVKRGVGKPSKGDDARNKCITLRATTNEITAWRKEADEQGVSFSEFVLGPLRRYMTRRKRKGSG